MPSSGRPHGGVTAIAVWPLASSLVAEAQPSLLMSDAGIIPADYLSSLTRGLTYSLRRPYVLLSGAFSICVGGEMTTVLRPMSTGEVLDRTFSLYRNNFVLFFGISTLPPAFLLLVQLIAYAVQGAGNRSAVATVAQPGSAPTFGLSTRLIAWIVVVVIFAIVYMIGLWLAQAATVFGVSAVHLDRFTTIRQCYGRLRGRVGRILGLTLLVLLIVGFGTFLLILLGGMLFGLLAALGAMLGAGGIIVSVVLGIAAVVAGALLAMALFARYALAVPACVLEDLKVRQALKRSVFLAKGSRSRIIAIYFLVTVLNLVVTYALLLPFGLLALKAKGATLVVLTVSNHLVGFLVGALLGPVITIAISLVYYDERVRKEAFDLQLMMAAIDGPQPPQVAGAPAGNIG